MISVSESFFARWNSAGLDSSIAKVYPAGERPKSKNNPHGTPVGNDLPRAEYEISNPPPQKKTRNSRILMVPIIVRVWGSGNKAVAEYVQLIKDKFVNAESTMTMSGGDILEVDEGNAFTKKVDDGVFAGMVMLLFRVRIGNAEVTS